MGFLDHVHNKQNYGICNFFNKLILLLSNDVLKQSSDSKAFFIHSLIHLFRMYSILFIIEKYSILIKCCSLEISIHQKILRGKVVSTKILNRQIFSALIVIKSLFCTK